MVACRDEDCRHRGAGELLGQPQNKILILTEIGVLAEPVHARDGRSVHHDRDDARPNAVNDEAEEESGPVGGRLWRGEPEGWPARCVYYLEQDRATSSPRQIATRKSKGYAKLANLQGHRKHFPETTRSDFRVLLLTTSGYRAQKTADEMEAKSGNDLWLMMNQSVLTAENLFTGDVAIGHDGVLGPLINIKSSEDVPSKESAPKESPPPHIAAPTTT